MYMVRVKTTPSYHLDDIQNDYYRINTDKIWTLSSRLLYSGGPLMKKKKK